jgi:DNA polymerase
VPGEGPESAKIVLVGEQPGDAEDRAGRPFIGPAGEVLDQALVAAGVARDEIYITNALKAFKYEPMSDRRIHKRPDAYEVEVCRPWLDAELSVVEPQLIVALGTTAAQTLLGRRVGIEQARRQIHHARGGRRAMVTYHPSAVLRRPDPAASDRVFEALVADLAAAHRTV